MTFLLGRDGKISVFRVSLLAIGIGLLFFVGAVIAFQIDTSSRQSPLEIEVYPGAIYWGERQPGRTRRSVYYQVTDASPEEVADYYQQLINDFYGSDPTQEANKAASQQEPNINCIRVPSAGNASDYVPDTGKAAYKFTCTFDRSYSGLTQVTEVIIQPGDSNSSDPNFQNTEGMTLIEFSQLWQP